jgi:hypothetical protein
MSASTLDRGGVARRSGSRLLICRSRFDSERPHFPPQSAAENATRCRPRRRQPGSRTVLASGSAAEMQAMPPQAARARLEDCFARPRVAAKNASAAVQAARARSRGGALPRQSCSRPDWPIGIGRVFAVPRNRDMSRRGKVQSIAESAEWFTLLNMTTTSDRPRHAARLTPGPHRLAVKVTALSRP